MKYSEIGSITISLVSTKHWVTEIGLLKLQIGTKVFEGVLQQMVSPNFQNEVLRISVSDTKDLLSGPVSLFSEAWHLAFIWWSFRPLKFLQSCPQLHDTPLILVKVLVGLSCFVPVFIPDLVLQLLILPPPPFGQHWGHLSFSYL